MDNKHRATLFAVLAALMAALSAPVVADTAISRGAVVVPLVLMGLLLFVAGYYVGLAKSP